MCRKKIYESVKPKAYDDVEESMRKRFSSNAYLEVALSIADKKWKAMAEKYPCVDYESAIENPWYKDEAKFQNLLKDIDKDINKDLKPIIDNFNKEYEQCKNKIFESGREKCKEKLREKTLKQLQAKLK
ncbi:hypothetical protein [Helicobacter cinaedi]|uniref:hypothetical protein n=1 Tax=Helicobacter cinaedi TaxID=213 RepID=UPI0011C0579F|nr:hypothetical protein [Helicobacter cinaedi]